MSAHTQVAAYNMICKDLEVPPDPTVIGTLKTNSSYLKVGKTQPHHAEGRYLALVELLLYQCEGSTHEDEGTRRVLENFRKRRARSASVTGSDIHMTPITHLDLSGYGTAAGANGGGLLRVLLSVDRHLTTLEIHNSDLNAHSAETMSEGLLKNRTLKTLILEGNPLGMEGAVALANNLPDDTNLMTLDITNTQASFKGVQQLTARVTEINALRATQSKPLLKCLTERNFCLEELANSISHGIASVAAIFGASLLLPKASQKGEREFLACFVFIAAMLTCYVSSTLYHSMFMLKRTQKVFKILDHSAIYLLIAGTYTPVVLIQLYHIPECNMLLVFQWVIAFLGITMRALAPEESKFIDRLQLFLFVAMGWSALTVVPHMLALDSFFRNGIIYGGISYTVGIIFFIRGEVWPMYHAIWHLFTIVGGLCHFLVIYSSVS